MFIKRLTTFLCVRQRMEETWKSFKAQLSSDLQLSQCHNYIPIINVYIPVCYWPSCNRLPLTRPVCWECQLCFNLPPTPLLSAAVTGKLLHGSGGAQRLQMFALAFIPVRQPLRGGFTLLPQLGAIVGPYRSCTTPLRMGRIIPAVISPICGAYAAMHFCRQFINIEKIICILLKLSSWTIVQKMIVEVMLFHILVFWLI